MAHKKKFIIQKFIKYNKLYTVFNLISCINIIKVKHKIIYSLHKNIRFTIGT